MCSSGSDWHYDMIGSDNGLASNMRQAIVWTNEDLVYWRIYASLGLSELIPSFLDIHIYFLKMQKNKLVRILQTKTADHQCHGTSSKFTKLPTDVIWFWAAGIDLKMSSSKWQPFLFGPAVLRHDIEYVYNIFLAGELVYKYAKNMRFSQPFVLMEISTNLRKILQSGVRLVISPNWRYSDLIFHFKFKHLQCIPLSHWRV